MINNEKNSLILLSGLMMIVSFAFITIHKPLLHTIGDSTLRNSNKETWGWDKPIAALFDITKMQVDNNAMPGRSTRTYLSEEFG